MDAEAVAVILLLPFHRKDIYQRHTPLYAYTLLKRFEGTLRVLPLTTINCTHKPTHSQSWINKAKTCLSRDKFGNRTRMVVLDENEVIPFQKSPWNTLYKNRILLKIPFFQSKFKDDVSNKNNSISISEHSLAF